VPRSYKEDTRGDQVSSIRESLKKRGSRKGTPFREDLSAEAEKSQLLEIVTRERLKRQQAGKDLGGAVVICELWRLPVTL
jgi:hypothetical protein